MITDVSDFYTLNRNLKGRLCGELITANIDEYTAKEEVRVANPMIGMVRTRLRSIFGSSYGSNYEDADECTLIMEMKQFMQPPSLNPIRRTIIRGRNGTAINMRKMSVSVRMPIFKIFFELPSY